MYIRQFPRGLSAHLALMSECQLFSGLTQEECGALASFAASHTFEPGESLFIQGQQVTDVIVIESGSIKLSQRTPKGDTIILRMCARGDTPVIPLQGSQSRYTCAAYAVGRCSVMRWDAHFIQDAMTQFPEIRKNIDSLVSQKLQEMEERFWELLTMSGARRLALTIVRLSKTIGREMAEGTFIPITRDELARMSGMTMFTVSRYIAAWSDTGSILRGRKEALVVRDPSGLLTHCGDTCSTTKARNATFDGGTVNFEGAPVLLKDLNISRRPASTATEVTNKAAPEKTRQRVNDLLDDLIREKYFTQPRGIAAVRDQLADRAHHCPITALTNPLLGYVMKGKLRRMKESGKYVYSQRD
jgi:CRP-like cAMP-binding protein